MNFTIEAFAERHKLRLSRDDCRDQFIPGKRGQIFDYGDGLFGAMVLNASPRTWNSVRRKMAAAGFQVIQDGDGEGAALFDPTDRQQVRIARRVIQAYRHRIYSPENLGRLRQNAALARESLATRASHGQDSIAAA